jgi:predicted transcriptional regulator
MESRAMTLRLPAEQAAALEAIARAEHRSVSETVRQAIAKDIEERRKDKKFQARLKRMIEEDREILERLAQ